MPKKIERNELEYLRSLNRRLQSQVRQLEKQLKHYQKRDHLVPDVVPEKAQEEVLNLCTRCRRGVVIDIDLQYLVIKRCSCCSHEEKVRKSQP